MKVERIEYKEHYREIKSGRQLRSCLRAGDYAWPGGYQLIYITNDGCVICPDCIRNSLYETIYSIRHEYMDRVVGCDLMELYDDESDCYCDDCGTNLTKAGE